jgi:hypothetical protein
MLFTMKSDSIFFTLTPNSSHDKKSLKPNHTIEIHIIFQNDKKYIAESWATVGTYVYWRGAYRMGSIACAVACRVHTSPSKHRTITTNYG